MVKFKKISFERTHTPDVILELEDGTVINNRDLPDTDRIVGEITVVNVEDRQTKYEKKTDGETLWKYNDVVKTHVGKITGLESVEGPNKEKIKDGESLCSFPTSQLTDKLIRDFYFKAMGLHQDNLNTSDDVAEFSKGED